MPTPFILTCLLAAGADPKPDLRFVGPRADAPEAVEATGLSSTLTARLTSIEPRTPDDWAAVLKVVVADGTEVQIADRPALIGTYSFRGAVLRFEPRFPFAPGVRYRATLADGPTPVAKTFTVPKPATEPATVTAVYPSGDRLPENTLRFYVHFAKPMSRGDAYKYVRLVNETDKTDVQLPFLELDEELWSPDRTRFTLLIDPGRIKREVKPREDLGPALEAGKTFTLIVSRDWPDADGNRLRAEFRKTFVVGPPDRTPIDPAKWTIDPPKGAGPVTVRVDKPLDRALLERLVWVAGPDGKKVAATAAAADGERQLRLTAPGGGWRPGRYTLVIDPRLEDSCGNRVGEPFEAEMLKAGNAKSEREPVTRAFEIR